MARIDEHMAAEMFVKELKNGKYSTECSKNTDVTYCKEKEEQDTLAVKEFTKSILFEQFR